MGKSGGGGGDTEVKARYAKYVEEHHSRLLDLYSDNIDLELEKDTPFADVETIDFVQSGMFGNKGQQLSDYPSIYGLMKLFVIDNDIGGLFNTILNSVMDNPTIDNQVSAHGDFLDDEITENSIPRYVTGMRDMNAVVSSSFVIGKSLIETARTKAISRYDAEIRTKLYPIALQRWQVQVEWLSKVIPTYMEMYKLYITSYMDAENYNRELAVKDDLWKFTILDNYRVAIGTMQGAMNTATDVKGASTGQKAIGGAVSGAAAGMMIGGPVGGAIGGVLGLAGSFF